MISYGKIKDTIGTVPDCMNSVCVYVCVSVGAPICQQICWLNNIFFIQLQSLQRTINASDKDIVHINDECLQVDIGHL